MHWVVSVMVIGEGALSGISDGDRCGCIEWYQ